MRIRGIRVAGVTLLLAGLATMSGAQSDSSAARTPLSTTDVAFAGVVLVGSGGLAALDVRVAHWTRGAFVQGGADRRRFVRAATTINEWPLTLTSAAVYGIGLATHSTTTADIGLHVTESLLVTEGVMELLRSTIGRTRPRASREDQYDFHPGGGFVRFERRSFPSLHAAVAFAVAGALVGEIRQRSPAAVGYAAPALITIALIPGVTRLYLDQHWLSDVVAGMAGGWLIGDGVVRYNYRNRPRP